MKTKTNLLKKSWNWLTTDSDAIKCKALLKQKNNRLFKYHMLRKSEHIGHAIVARKLAQQQLKTHDEYKMECSNHGIPSYNKETFSDFMNQEVFTNPEIETSF